LTTANHKEGFFKTRIDAMDDETRKAFKEALEQAQKQARGEVTLLPAYLALAKCWEWINVKAATTGSAGILQTILESLANEGKVNLSDIRALDGERRMWVASMMMAICFNSSGHPSY
jgi:hypothetical protein